MYQEGPDIFIHLNAAHPPMWGRATKFLPRPSQLLTPGSGSHPQGFVCPDSPPGPADTPCTVSWPVSVSPHTSQTSAPSSAQSGRVWSPCWTRESDPPVTPLTSFPDWHFRWNPPSAPVLPGCAWPCPEPFCLLICLSFQTKATKRSSCSEP